jgi:hypothetical protein
MISVRVSTVNKKALDEHINFVKKLLLMKTDKKFQKYIQDKCKETVVRVTNELMQYNGPTVEAYKNNHKIKETNDGFILYNDTVVEVESEGYGGTFPIALAFEYGTGIVGSKNPKMGAWAYNINNYKENVGWTYYKNGEFKKTEGYEGMEIYRKTAIEIKKLLKTWVMNYYEGKEV